MRLVLIDKRVQQIDDIIDSLTPETEHRVFDHENDTIPNIQNRIVKNYESVAIIQHNYNLSYYKLVNSCVNSTLTNLATTDPELESWEEYIAFLVWLKTERGVEFVDLLSCNLWADDNWKYLIKTVRTREGIHIRASLNITGSGGDFILESDEVNMVGLYFTEDILDYKHAFLASGHSTQFVKFEFTKRFTVATSYKRVTIGRIFFFSSPTSIDNVYSGTSVVTSASTTITGFTTGSYSPSAIVNNTSSYSTSGGIPVLTGTLPDGGPEYPVPNTTSTTDTTIIVVIDLGQVRELYGYVFFTNRWASEYYGSGSIPSAWTLYKSSNDSSGPWTEIDNKDVTSRGYPSQDNVVNFWTSPVVSGNVYYSAWELTVPGKPVISSITSGNNSLTVNFTAPAQGQSAITNYAYSLDGGVYTTVGTTIPIVINTGLVNGTTYQVRILARNTQGDSPASDPVSGTPFTVPDPPIINSIVSNASAQLTVNFTAPFSGGNTITNYAYSLNNGSTYTTVGTTIPITISSGLVNGTTYQVRILARNAAGNSTASNPVSGTPFTVPDPPTINSIVSGNTTLTVNFTAPTSNGGNTITNYWVSTNNGTSYNSMNSTTSPFTVTGLINGTSYNVRILATNARGNSNASAAVSGTPFTVPGQPTISSIVSGNTTLTVNFTAPSTGGNTITNYAYSLDGGAYTTVGTTIPITISSGLVNGTTYQVRILARNAAGNSTASNPVSGTPFTVPDPPTINSIVSGNTTLTVNFTAPTSNGGNTITNYWVSTNNGTSYNSMNSTTSPFTVTGLINGTSYSVRILATNASGNSIASTAVSGTPFTVPGQPTINNITGGNNRLTVFFTAPTSNGGNTITTYLYSLNSGTYTSINGTTSPFDISDGVVNGATYNVTIVARNAQGNSLPSNNVSLFLLATPSPVSFDSGNTLTIQSGNLQVAILDTSNVALNSVYYWYSIDGGNVYSNTNIRNNGPQNSPYVFYITGLLNQTYTVSVYGNNSVYTSTVSTITRTVYVTPNQPVINPLLTFSQTSGNLTISFNDTVNSSLNDISYYYYIELV